MTSPLTSARLPMPILFWPTPLPGRTEEWSLALGSQHPVPSREGALAQNTNTRLRAWVTRSSAQRLGTETEGSEVHKIGS